jgi:hypothetical protein
MFSQPRSNDRSDNGYDNTLKTADDRDRRERRWQGKNTGRIEVYKYIYKKTMTNVLSLVKLEHRYVACMGKPGKKEKSR